MERKTKNKKLSKSAMGKISNIPSYKVQDPNARLAKYKQKFMECAKEMYPQIIDDLREASSNFKALFTYTSNKNYSNILDELRRNLVCDSAIYSDQQNPDNHPIDYKYVWGVFKLPLRLIEIKHSLSGYTISNCVPEDKQLIEENNFTLEIVANKIKQTFGTTASDSDMILFNFCKLQRIIYDWVEKYDFRKDWLVDYAYHFLNQFSENLDLRNEDIGVGLKKYDFTATLYFPFKFETRGWWASEDGEKAEEFKIRVTREFEEKLDQYISEANSYLKLNGLSKFTKPPKYMSIKWLVYAVIGGRNAEAILIKYFDEIFSNRNSSQAKYLEFENKLKYITSEIRRLSRFDLPMPKGF